MSQRFIEVGKERSLIELQVQSSDSWSRRSKGEKICTFH